MSRGYVVPQCPIAGDATGLEGDFSRTVRVYGSHNTETTVRLFIVCIVVKESGTPENIYACGLRSRFRLLGEPGTAAYRIVALWGTQQHQIFVQNGQTANVVYTEVLSC